MQIFIENKYMTERQYDDYRYEKRQNSLNVSVKNNIYKLTDK